MFLFLYVVLSDLPRTLLVVVIFQYFQQLRGERVNFKPNFRLSGGKFALSGGWGRPLPTSVGRTLSTILLSVPDPFLVYIALFDHVCKIISIGGSK